MQSPEEAARWFERYRLGGVPRFSDPTHELYRAFNLEQGSVYALAHPRVWSRWMRVMLSRGAGLQGSHWRQLTGVFLLEHDRVLAALRHSNSAARPDYLRLVRTGLTARHNT